MIRPTLLSTAAAALLLATGAHAELALFDSRPDWEAAATRPLFTEDFETLQRDIFLDLEPAALLGGALVVTSESSHNLGIRIDTPMDGSLSDWVDTGGVNFTGNYIVAEANNLFTGLLRIEVPPGADPVHAIGFDFSGVSGALIAVDNPLYVGFRIATDDGAITEGRIADIDGDDVQGDAVRPPTDGFFGAHDPDRAIVSLELFTLFTDFFFPNSGKGEGYAIDNLTIGLSDEDGDGLPDAFETEHGLDNAADDSAADLDQDGLSNLDELRRHTDPARPDSDRDGVDDGAEVTAGSDPNDRNDPAQFDLLVDFGPRSQPYPYRDYLAGDQVAEDFDSRTYTAFGGSVTVAPSFPDTSAATAQRVVKRPNPWGSFTWGQNGRRLVLDYLGVDTDPSAGGNGSYDGVNGDPTRLTLTLGDLPKGGYSWTSMHHDFDDTRTEFIAEISTDGGASFSEIARSRMTYSRVRGAILQPGSFHGPLPELLPSTVNTTFEADGINDVVLRFTPLPTGTADTRLFGINGFQLSQTFAPVELLDPTVEAAVRRQLGKPEGGLTTSDMEELLSLSLSGSSPIQTLEGLQAAINLGELTFVSGTAISPTVDLSALAALPELRRLSISGSSLTSLPLPEGLNRLETLILRGSQVTDFSFLLDLPSLSILDLAGYQLTSIVLPEGLSSLTSLHLGSSELTELTLPPGLTNLETLLLSNGPPKYIDMAEAYRWPLESLTLSSDMVKLSVLSVSHQHLTSLEIPDELTNLTTLILCQNDLTRLALPSLPRLSELYLSHNPLVEDQDRLAQVLSTIPESTQLDIPIPIPCSISLSPSGGGISLRWRTQPGRLTMVLASDDLRSWSQLGSQPAADAEFTTFTDHPESFPASRFYRLLLPPQLDEWETCDDFIILY